MNLEEKEDKTNSSIDMMEAYKIAEKDFNAIEEALEDELLCKEIQSNPKDELKGVDMENLPKALAAGYIQSNPEQLVNVLLTEMLQGDISSDDKKGLWI